MKKILCFLLLLAVPAGAFALDTVFLKNGKILRGKITQESGETLTFETGAEWKEINFRDIKKVVRGAAGQQAQPQAYPAQQGSAQGYTPAPPPRPSRFLKPDPSRYHSFEALSHFTHFDYKETLPAPLKSTEKAWIPGILLKYGYHKNKISASFAFAYSGGDTVYDGSTQAGAPLMGTSGNSFMNMEALASYALPAGLLPARLPKLTAYAGIGRRVWDRTLGLGTSSSYLETYSWNYFPVGLRADFKSGDKLSIGIDASVRIMTGGEIMIALSSIGFNDLTLKLGSKTGYRLAAPADYAYSDNWSFLLTPWYEHSAIGKSNTGNLTAGGIPVGTAYEPASNTSLYGVNLGLVYKFSTARK